MAARSCLTLARQHQLALLCEVIVRGSTHWIIGLLGLDYELGAPNGAVS